MIAVDAPTQLRRHTIRLGPRSYLALAILVVMCVLLALNVAPSGLADQISDLATLGNGSPLLLQLGKTTGGSGGMVAIRRRDAKDEPTAISPAPAGPDRAERAVMWTAIGEALPLATGLALSPLAVITGIVLLLGQRGRIKTALFALGWLVAIFVIAAIALWLVEAADDVAAEETATGVDAVQLLFGLLFLALAVLTWRKRPRRGEPVPENKLLARLNKISIVGALGLGLAQGFVVIKNIPLALGAGARLGEAGLVGAAAVAGLLIFALVSTAGVLVPLAVALVAGQRLNAPLAAARGWLETNMSPITMTVLAVLGFYFLGQSLSYLD